MMKKSLITFAGIFLTCVICAGVPAVAAAENINPALNPGNTIKPAETPQPWYTPIAELFGMHQPADNAGQQGTTGKDSDRPVNVTANQPVTEKAWWENLLPSERIKESPEQATSSQTPAQNPAPAPVITQAPDPAHPANPPISSTPSTPINQQKPQNSPVQRTP
ncbi:hypothetical protein [uncultured Methanoregula sp.]|uniref:hypothetical protein n=1 Tax=uncultured Methanoregula sp. TaxID=1005933 RepID=UPI002AABE00B|nr:hypothetical protein [uncultured Methanoregula sp.]